MALPAHHRIPREGFASILKKGKTVQCSFFFLKIQKRAASPGLFGVVISARVVKRASQRNAARRALHETARLQMRRLLGYDVVCVLTRPILDMNQARGELAEALLQI